MTRRQDSKRNVSRRFSAWDRSNLPQVEYIALNCTVLMTIMTFMTYSRAKRTTAARKWTVAEAKAKFSEVISRAQSDGPQTITRKGRKAAVIVSAEEWERKTKRRGTLAEFFASSPLRGSGLQIKRDKRGPRKIAL